MSGYSEEKLMLLFADSNSEDGERSRGRKSPQA